MTCELQLNKAVIKDYHKRSLEREKEARGATIGMTLSLLPGHDLGQMAESWLLPVASDRSPASWKQC